MMDEPPELQDLKIPHIPLRLIASIAAVLLLLALAWTSCYTVQAESEGVVLRFGKFLKTVEPGLHFKLPFSIDHVTVLPTRRQLKLEFGFVTPGTTNPYQPGNKAQQDRENAINIANGDYNEAVPRARGQADQMIRAAEGYRFKRVNEAQGDVASFNAILAEYVKAPEITRTRLYLETMGDVLPATGEKIIIDDSMRNLLPILPLNPKPLEKR